MSSNRSIPEDVPGQDTDQKPLQIGVFKLQHSDGSGKQMTHSPGNEDQNSHQIIEDDAVVEDSYSDDHLPDSDTGPRMEDFYNASSVSVQNQNKFQAPETEDYYISQNDPLDSTEYPVGLEESKGPVMQSGVDQADEKDESSYQDDFQESVEKEPSTEKNLDPGLAREETKTLSRTKNNNQMLLPVADNDDEKIEIVSSPESNKRCSALDQLQNIEDLKRDFEMDPGSDSEENGLQNLKDIADLKDSNMNAPGEDEDNYEDDEFGDYDDLGIKEDNEELLDEGRNKLILSEEEDDDYGLGAHPPLPETTEQAAKDASPKETQETRKSFSNQEDQIERKLELAPDMRSQNQPSEADQQTKKEVKNKFSRPDDKIKRKSHKEQPHKQVEENPIIGDGPAHKDLSQETQPEQVNMVAGSQIQMEEMAAYGQEASQDEGQLSNKQVVITPQRAQKRVKITSQTKNQIQPVAPSVNSPISQQSRATKMRKDSEQSVLKKQQPQSPLSDKSKNRRSTSKDETEALRQAKKNLQQTTQLRKQVMKQAVQNTPQQRAVGQKKNSQKFDQRPTTDVISKLKGQSISFGKQGKTQKQRKNSRSPKRRSLNNDAGVLSQNIVSEEQALEKQEDQPEIRRATTMTGDDKLSSIGNNGNIINVHQHFNQPNIMNLMSNNEEYALRQLMGPNMNFTPSDKDWNLIQSQLEKRKMMDVQKSERAEEQKSPSDDLDQSIGINLNSYYQNGHPGRKITAPKRNARNIVNSTDNLTKKPNKPQNRAGSSLNRRYVSKQTNQLTNILEHPYSHQIRNGSRSTGTRTAIGNSTTQSMQGHFSRNKSYIRSQLKSANLAHHKRGARSRANGQSALSSQQQFYLSGDGEESRLLDVAVPVPTTKKINQVSPHIQSFSAQNSHAKLVPFNNFIGQQSSGQPYTGEEASTILSGPNKFSESMNPLKQFSHAEIPTHDPRSNSRKKNRLRSANIFGSKINTSMLIYTPQGTQQLKIMKPPQATQKNSIMSQPYSQNSQQIIPPADSMQMLGQMNPTADQILKIGTEQTNKHMQQLVIDQHKNRSRSRPLDNIKKEDIYDQLLKTKKELNAVQDENKKYKTKNVILRGNMKNKDKFIDELLKVNTLFSQTLSSEVGANVIRTAKEAIQDGPPSSPTKANEAKQQFWEYFRQNYIDKGPYNLLKLKKEVQTLRDLVIDRDDEIATLKKNIIITNTSEMQAQIAEYQKECMKLRRISEQATGLLILNGLENQMNGNKDLRSFSKIFKWAKFPNETEQSMMFQQSPLKELIVYPPNEIIISEEDKVGRDSAIPTNEQSLLIPSNQGSQPVEKDLQAQKQEHALNQGLIEKLMEHNRVLQNQFSDLKSKYDKQKEFISQTEHETNQMKHELSEMEVQLQGQVVESQILKAEQNVVDSVSQQEEVKSSEVPGGPLSVATDLKKTYFSTQAENKEADDLLNQKDKEIQALKKRVEELEASRNKQSAKDEATANYSSIDDCKPFTSKNPESIEVKLREEIGKKLKLKEKIKEQKSSLIQLNKYIATVEERCSTSQKQLSDQAAQYKQVNEERQKLLAEVKQSQNLLISQNKEYIELQNTIKKLQSENQNILKDMAEKNIELMSIRKDRSDSKLQESANLKPSSVMKLSEKYEASQKSNSVLKEEILYLQEKLLNLNIEDIDERSDALSQMKSHILRTQNSIVENANLIKSPCRIQKQITKKSYQSKKNVEIIEEYAEDGEDIEDRSVQKLQSIIQRQQIREERKKALRLGTIGKSNSNVDANSFNFLEKAKRQQTQQKILDQIDNIPDSSTILTDNISQFNQSEMINNGDIILECTTFVKKNDPCVRLALERMQRLQQVKRINLDHVDKELFGQEVKPNQHIRLIELAQIFHQKLSISEYESIRFARFLIEDRDENQYEDRVEYDPKKKVEIQQIQVRLMMNSNYPLIFNDEHEQEVRDVFQQAFEKKQNRFIRLIHEQRNNQFISLMQLTMIIAIILGEDHGIDKKRIECAYVMLCRGVPFSQINSLSDEDILNSLQGFNCKNISLIFHEITDEETNYEPSDFLQVDNAELSDKSKKAGINKSKTVVEGSKHYNKYDPHKIDFKKRESMLDKKKGEFEDIQTPVTPVLGGICGGFHGKVSALNFPGARVSESKKRSSFPASSNSIRNENFGVQGQDRQSSQKDSNSSGNKQIPQFTFKSNSMGFPGEKQQASTPDPRIYEIKSQEETGENNSSRRKEEDLEAAQLYSASRSETDFDMQTSIGRNNPEFGQILGKLASQDGTVKSVLDKEKSFQEAKYNKEDVDIIKQQAQEISKDLEMQDAEEMTTENKENSQNFAVQKQTPTNSEQTITLPPQIHDDVQTISGQTKKPSSQNKSNGGQDDTASGKNIEDKDIKIDSSKDVTRIEHIEEEMSPSSPFDSVHPLNMAKCLTSKEGQEPKYMSFKSDVQLGQNLQNSNTERGQKESSIEERESSKKSGYQNILSGKIDPGDFRNASFSQSKVSDNKGLVNGSQEMTNSAETPQLLERNTQVEEAYTQLMDAQNEPLEGDEAKLEEEEQKDLTVQEVLVEEVDSPDTIKPKLGEVNINKGDMVEIQVDRQQSSNEPHFGKDSIHGSVGSNKQRLMNLDSSETAGFFPINDMNPHLVVEHQKISFAAPPKQDQPNTLLRPINEKDNILGMSDTHSQKQQLQSQRDGVFQIDMGELSKPAQFDDLEQPSFTKKLSHSERKIGTGGKIDNSPVLSQGATPKEILEEDREEQKAEDIGEQQLEIHVLQEKKKEEEQSNDEQQNESGRKIEEGATTNPAPLQTSDIMEIDSRHLARPQSSSNTKLQMEHNSQCTYQTSQTQNQLQNFNIVEGNINNYPDQQPHYEEEEQDNHHDSQPLQIMEEEKYPDDIEFQPPLPQIEFSEEQIQSLKETLFRILSSKIDDELQKNMNQSSIRKVIEYATDIFQRVGEKMLQQSKLNLNFVDPHQSCVSSTDPEVMPKHHKDYFSLRDLFHRDIHVVKDISPVPTSSSIKSGQILSDNAESSEIQKLIIEIEVVKPTDLIARFDQFLKGESLDTPISDEIDDTQLPYNQKCILIILQNPRLAELISFREVCQAFDNLGIPEGKPLQSKHMDYQSINLKSIRVLNRLFAYIEQNFEGHSDSYDKLMEFMSDIVSKQDVKTKTSNQKVEIFMAKKFFHKLHKLNIRKSNSVLANLCDFLCLDKKYQNFLMLKKLKRCMVDFKSQRYFSLIGFNKRKLDLQQYPREQMQIEGASPEQL